MPRDWSILRLIHKTGLFKLMAVAIETVDALYNETTKDLSEINESAQTMRATHKK